MKKVYQIYCRTGCNYENHYRGFYKTKEDAQKRVNYYLSKDSKFWTLASQYASRGCYEIEELDVEELPDRRFIIDDSEVLHKLNIVELNESGSIDDNESEYLRRD